MGHTDRLINSSIEEANRLKEELIGLASVPDGDIDEKVEELTGAIEKSGLYQRDFGISLNFIDKIKTAQRLKKAETAKDEAARLTKVSHDILGKFGIEREGIKEEVTRIRERVEAIFDFEGRKTKFLSDSRAQLDEIESTEMTTPDSLRDLQLLIDRYQRLLAIRRELLEFFKNALEDEASLDHFYREEICNKRCFWGAEKRKRSFELKLKKEDNNLSALQTAEANLRKATELLEFRDQVLAEFGITESEISETHRQFLEGLK